MGMKNLNVQKRFLRIIAKFIVYYTSFFSIGGEKKELFFGLFLGL